MKKKSTIKLRDYQARDVERIVSAFPKSRRVMYQLPVGGGKTVVASAVMATMSCRVLVLAHRTELREQMGRTVDGFRIDPARVVLMSQKKARRLSDEALAEFGLVVVDEAHRAGGPEYRSVLERVTSPILGLSASPYRREGLDGDFDELLEGPSVQELVDAGHILAPRCWSVPEDREPDLKGVGSTAGDYNLGELDRAVNKPYLVGDIVLEWTERAEGRSTLIFATSIKHAESIAAAFLGTGVDARIVHGKTPEAERKSAIEAFEAGDFHVLVNVLLLTEGVDIKRIDCLVLARPTRSIVLYIQAIGRAMRPSPTGLQPLVLDHSGAVRHHGLPTMPQRWSLSPAPKESGGGGKRKMAKQCPACGTMNHISAAECAHCGATFRIEDPETRLEEVKERRCSECEKPITRHSATGRCRDCANRANMRNMSQEQLAERGRRLAQHARKGGLSSVGRMTAEQLVQRGKHIAPARKAKQHSDSIAKSLSMLSPEQLSERMRKVRGARRAKVAGESGE